MKEEIKLLATHLQSGDTLRTKCPSCHGGKTGESSLSITRDNEGVVYYCFRSSCGLRGSYQSKPGLYVQDEKDEKAERVAFKIKEAELVWDYSVPIEGRARDHVVSKYGEDVALELGGRFCEEKMRVLFPAFWGAELRGFIARTVLDEQPKVLSYRLMDKPLLALYNHSLMRKIHGAIIVEDMPSAAAISATMLPVAAIALNGTDTSPEGWDDIKRKCNGVPVCIALDADAREKSVTLMMKHRSGFFNLSAYLIDEDFKDMAPEKRKEVVREIMRGFARGE